MRKWLGAHGTTIAVAVLLAVVTVGLLRSGRKHEQDPSVLLIARFRPEIKAPVESLEYFVDGKRYTTEIPVTVWAARPQISVIRLTCAPVLDEATFAAGAAARETTVKITAEDFDLTPEQEKKVRIKPFTVLVKFTPVRSS